MPQKKFENKKNTLPSVGIGTRQRNLFAECQARHLVKTARLPSANGQHSAKGDGGATGVARGILPSVILCRVSDTRQRGRLPSVPLCRVFDTRQTASLPSARVSTLGKAPSTRQRARLP